MAAFVQIMSYTTTKPDEMDGANKRWLEATEGVHTVRRRLLLKDRDVADRYVDLVFFDSYEDAMHTSRLPATNVHAREALEFTDGVCEFVNLDVVAEGF